MSNIEGGWSPPPPPGGDPEFSRFWVRFVAHLLDQVSVLILAIPLGIVGYSLSGAASVVWTVVSAVAASWLLAKWTAQRGGSPWRARFGVLVLDRNTGSFLPMERSLRRALFPNMLGMVAAYVPGIWAIVLIDYLWMLWDPGKQTLHDKIADSKVVNRR
ncbi:MAG: hypothetical protein RLZZ305_300 [Actinomycetota bacterium]